MDYFFMGRQIRRFRRSREMSQSELAAAIGLSAAHVGHIERGSRHASLETIVAISQQLEVSLDELVFPQPIARMSHMESESIHQLRQLLLSAGEIIGGLVTTAAD